MGLEDRDYREKFGGSRQRVVHQAPPRRGFTPVWPPWKAGLPLRRRGTGQHVELARLRQSEGERLAATEKRSAGLPWPLVVWTLGVATVIALGGLVAMLT